MQTYFNAVRRLTSLQNLEQPWKHSSPESLRDSFIRLRQLLARLGNPQDNFSFIHVTGTSGKGSVTHLIHEMLQADGRRVASYSSPHTTTLLERYAVGDKLLDPKVFVQAVNIVLAAHESHVREGKQDLTFFELTTCIAFVAFALEKVKWCVLEVGLGGHWDSTNIIKRKEVAVITNIDLDHTDVLGHTREEIAHEKAGIITGRCIVISGETKQNIRAIIKDAAEAKKSPVTFVTAPNDDHLLHNALIATAAARAVGVTIDTVETALANHHGLPCRFEVIQNSPRVIIDGAHNEAKMRATIRTLENSKMGRVHVIFACKGGKDAKTMLAQLVKVADSIHTTRYAVGRLNPEHPAELLRLVPKNKRGQMFLYAEDALQHVLNIADKNDTVLVTGSLYLAGELRTHWVSEEKILRTLSSQVKN